MLNKILTNAVVTEDGVARIHQLLGGLVRDVDATAAFLVEKSGQMLATEGEIRGLDTTAIASLVMPTAYQIGRTGAGPDVELPHHQQM